MTDPTESARDDLAFVRALMSESGQVQDSLGQALLAAGLSYGVQCLIQAFLATGIEVPVAVHLTVGILPTVIFLVAIIRITVRERGSSKHSVGTRAINAAFGGGGLAAMTTALIFGFLAFRTQNMGTWLLHPIMICVVQGTIWYIAHAVRRRGLYGLVSAGWFATALVLAALLGMGGPIPVFLLVLAAALLGLMALPGYILMRTAQRQA
ncbi:hypothetical protein HZY97_07255 [Sphingomonas sp. R-74633]|uniref:hypothetical protein n=1 Tax=Sphingomonas sp. R-74633 TaxID=2751188 RepID=UPI0015D2EED6|nr:hypothetical protein [Sphingomonas sp. R-74633]NYT40548.1 hypothetical protein [Sphingomonas sp. R-74633]